MLTEQEVQLLAERIHQRIQSANTSFLKILGRRIAKIGKLTPAKATQLLKTMAYLDDVEQIKQLLFDALNLSIKDVKDIYSVVVASSYNDVKESFLARGLKFTPFEENRQLQSIISRYVRQTAETIFGYTQSTAFAIWNENTQNFELADLSHAYQSYVEQAVAVVNSGASDYKSAIRQVMRQCADTGIRQVDYATGYHRRLDTSVRQNVLWGVKQCNQQAINEMGDQFDADGYKVSYHAMPRPSHAPMADVIFAKSLYPQTVYDYNTEAYVTYPSFYRPYGEYEENGVMVPAGPPAELLEEYNCLHFTIPVILGVSTPTYSKEILEKLKAEDAKTFTYEGKTYTKYEATQVQRKLESQIRKYKDRQILAKELGDDEMLNRSQMKIDQLTAKYKDFSDAAGLSYKKDRLAVSGYHKNKVYEHFLRNNLPKGFKDERHVGPPISKESLQEMMDYAHMKNVQIGTANNPTGGFETYCGDVSILKEMIDEVAYQQNTPLYQSATEERIILRYDNVLGYRENDDEFIDRSKIDIETFASVKGKTITLNKFMFDDSSFLQNEYAESEKAGHFVKRSNYKHIISHEIGHIMDKKRPDVKRRILTILENQAYKLGVDLDDYIAGNISKYAVKRDSNSRYCELLPEINSLLKLGENNDIIELLKEEGVLDEAR